MYIHLIRFHVEEEPTADAIDIKAAYEAKHGVLGAGAPRVFFRYFYVNGSTGEKSGEMLVSCKLAASENEEGNGDID